MGRLGARLLRVGPRAAFRFSCFGPPAVRTDSQNLELCPKRWFAVSLLQVRGPRRSWRTHGGAWEAVEETEKRLPTKRARGSRGNPSGGETSSTESWRLAVPPTHVCTHPRSHPGGGLPCRLPLSRQADPGPAVGWVTPSQSLPAALVPSETATQSTGLRPTCTCLSRHSAGSDPGPVLCCLRLRLQSHFL